MAELNDLLEQVRTALDPERFLSHLEVSVQGRSFLNGESDSVTLTRSFLDGEAHAARHGLEALEEIRRLLDLGP